MTLDELLEVARAREDVVGLYVFGSRGRSFMADERSDWDVCVVLADAEARDRFAREFPSAHGAQVEVITETLDAIRDDMSEHMRYASAHADVVLDKTSGELTQVVAGVESLPAGSRDAVVPEALDDYVNQTYRSLPCNKSLERELRHHPLDGWGADELLPLLDRVFAGEPAAQRDLFNRIEPLARREGFGDVIDGWKPDVDWLGGRGGYRDQ